MTTTAQLKRDIEIVNKALQIDAVKNYHFSTWGEFNETYLINLTETEKKQYWHLTLKFALMTFDIKNGREPTTIHNWTEEYVNDLEQRVEKHERR